MSYIIILLNLSAKKTKCGTCTQSNTCWPDGHRYTKRTILTASIIFYLYPDSNRQCHRCGKGKKKTKETAEKLC
jgi:hypothetical protein